MGVTNVAPCLGGCTTATAASWNGEMRVTQVWLSHCISDWKPHQALRFCYTLVNRSSGLLAVYTEKSCKVQQQYVSHVNAASCGWHHAETGESQHPKQGFFCEVTVMPGHVTLTFRSLNRCGSRRHLGVPTKVSTSMTPPLGSFSTRRSPATTLGTPPPTASSNSSAAAAMLPGCTWTAPRWCISIKRLPRDPRTAGKPLASLIVKSNTPHGSGVFD